MELVNNQVYYYKFFIDPLLASLGGTPREEGSRFPP
jgi:hypothetical protein